MKSEVKVLTITDYSKTDLLHAHAAINEEISGYQFTSFCPEIERILADAAAACHETLESLEPNDRAPRLCGDMSMFLRLGQLMGERRGSWLRRAIDRIKGLLWNRKNRS